MEERSAAARRITGVLFAAQCLASAAFIATSTVSAIAGTALSGQRGLAGVPAAASTLAGAGAAFLWGLLMDRLGRRPSLALGLFFGVAGAGLCIWGIAAGSFPVFVGGMMLVGVAQAAVTLSRFIAAEVQVPERRGRAVSTVVLGGTVGAIGGPLLVMPSGHLAMQAGTSDLAGAFGAAVFLLLAAGAVVAAALRPEPLTLVDHGPAEADPAAGRRPIAEILRVPAAAAAVIAMVFSQVVMVGVMVITSLYMKDMHHGLGDVVHVLIEGSDHHDPHHWLNTMARTAAAAAAFEDLRDRAPHGGPGQLRRGRGRRVSAARDGGQRPPRPHDGAAPDPQVERAGLHRKVTWTERSADCPDGSTERAETARPRRSAPGLPPR